MVPQEAGSFCEVPGISKAKGFLPSPYGFSACVLILGQYGEQHVGAHQLQEVARVRPSFHVLRGSVLTRLRSP